MRPRAPWLQAAFAFLSPIAQYRWDFLIVETIKKDLEIPPFFWRTATIYLKQNFDEFFKTLVFLNWLFSFNGTGSLGVSLGRRPPKKYRGRAKVRTLPFRGLSMWQSIILAWLQETLFEQARKWAIVTQCFAVEKTLIIGSKVRRG